METIFLILLTTFLISLISFVGLFSLSLKKGLLDKMLLYLVALSGGALLGGAFIHLLPEAIEMAGAQAISYTLAGIVLFFLVEKIFHWRHCHKKDCTIHSFAYMNLFGDAIHNFIDGLIVAVTFVTNPGLGITTAMAIALHEIPQEIGDFGVLIYGGFKIKRALLLNFLIALTAIAGGIIGYFASSLASQFHIILLPLAAGGFIYIAGSDLIPELRRVDNTKASALTFIIFLLGILIMWLAKFI